MISERFQELSDPSTEIDRFHGLLNEVVAEGSPLDTQDIDGKTLLHRFASEGQAIKVNALIEAGASVHKKCREGRTALSYAVGKCSVKLLESLIAKGSLIDEADFNGKTPISHAAMLGDLEKFKALITMGASVNIKDLGGNTPMHYLAENWWRELPLHYVKEFIELTETIYIDWDLVNSGGKSVKIAFAIYIEPHIRLAYKMFLDHQKPERHQRFIHPEWDHEYYRSIIFQLCHFAEKLGIRFSEKAVFDNFFDEVKKRHPKLAHLKPEPMLSRTFFQAIIFYDLPVAISLIKRGVRVDLDSYFTQEALTGAFEIEVLRHSRFPKFSALTQERVSELIEKIMKRKYTDYFPSDFGFFELPNGDFVRSPLTFNSIQKNLIKLARIPNDVLKLGCFGSCPETQKRLDALIEKYQVKGPYASGFDYLDRNQRYGLDNRRGRLIPSENEGLLEFTPIRVMELAKKIGEDEGQIFWGPGDLEKLLSKYDHLASANNHLSKQSIFWVSPNYDGVDRDASILELKDAFSRSLEAGEPGDPILNSRFASLWFKFFSKSRHVRFEQLFEYWTDSSDSEFVAFWNTTNARFFDPPPIDYLLARFGTSVLPGILRREELFFSRTAENGLKIWRASAPSVAPVMARLMHHSVARYYACSWFLNNPAEGSKGLVLPLISADRKDREVAKAALQYLAANGFGHLVIEVGRSLGNDVAKVLGKVVSNIRFVRLNKNSRTLPWYFQADCLPPPRSRDELLPLSPEGIESLAVLMSQSSVTSQHPSVAKCIKDFDRQSLADFAWELFEQWADHGSWKEGWILDALAYFSDDRFLKVLVTYINNWPKTNNQPRSFRALSVLAAIGSDRSIRHIYAVAAKSKHESVRGFASGLLEVVAKSRRLSSLELEDRLVPDLGLSPEGILELDFGPRRFVGSVDAQLNPMLTNDEGKRINKLPSARSRDDKTLAKAARQQWSAFCRELRSVAKAQLDRLETTMIEGRHWSVIDFQNFLCGSPLLQRAVQGLVWVKISDDGLSDTVFRVNEQGGFETVQGVTLCFEEEASVRVIHPVEFDANTLRDWQEVFTVKQLAQPFSQLGRKIYRRTDDVAGNFFGLQDLRVASMALYGLKARGWELDGDSYGGFVSRISKKFGCSDVSVYLKDAFLHIGYGFSDKEETRIEVMISGADDPIGFSEAIREVMTLKSH